MFNLYAWAGHGIHEQTLISILGKWHPEERKSFRKGSPNLFIEDERNFERWDDHRVKLLKHEFMRFKVIFFLFSFSTFTIFYLVKVHFYFSFYFKKKKRKRKK